MGQIIKWWLALMEWTFPAERDYTFENEPPANVLAFHVCRLQERMSVLEKTIQELRHENQEMRNFDVLMLERFAVMERRYRMAREELIKPGIN